MPCHREKDGREWRIEMKEVIKGWLYGCATVSTFCLVFIAGRLL
jgi:hypothetical protein